MNNNLPEEFQNKMRSLLLEEAGAFFASYEEERTYGLRINPLKCNEKAKGDILSLFCSNTAFEDHIPWCEHGFYYDRDSLPGKSPYHEAGAYYIQEPSAMAVASALDVKPGDRVCDLCAAPGGKTTHIAGYMKGRGLLLANEIVPDRARILAGNVERMGVGNCIVTNETPDVIADRFSGCFNKVLVDAPCSGEGMFRKDDTAVSEWSVENVSMCADRQRDILNCAAELVMAGGTLVYSTCTFEPDEDERAVISFLDEHEDFEIAALDINGIETHGNPKWCENDERALKTVRIWPHKSRGEGHFIAKLVKKGDSALYEDLTGKNKRSSEELIRFLHTELNISDDNELIRGLENGRRDVYNNGDYFFALPEGISESRMKRLRVIRPGVEIAKKCKNRFEPSHSMGMMLTPECLHNICNLTIDEGVRYIRGESIAVTGDQENGWTLVCVNGVSLGWCKKVGNTLKNHYPKGLRKNM